MVAAAGLRVVQGFGARRWEGVQPPRRLAFRRGKPAHPWPSPPRRETDPGPRLALHRRLRRRLCRLDPFVPAVRQPVAVVLVGSAAAVRVRLFADQALYAVIALLAGGVAVPGPDGGLDRH